MLELFVYGPYFGLPDGSPFCTKALTLMKMSGLPFKVSKMSFKQAPKGKAPYLKDGEKLIADSHFIQRHLENAHAIDFSGGYSPAQLAQGWALSRMVEEHLYFINLHFRWLNDENFRKGPYQFFAGIPGPIRPLVGKIIKGKQRKTMHLQGLGRHSEDERIILAKGDIDAVEMILGDKPFLFGAKPCGADASICAFVWSVSVPLFKTDVGDYVRSRPKLVAYIERMRAMYFPEMRHIKT